MREKEDNPQDRVRRIFSGPCTFRLGVADLAQLPEFSVPEIAFAGRSNVGKSSLINALMGRKTAHVSNTPGRTQQLNFFDIGEVFWLVDMPGYGYAKVAKSQKAAWDRLILDYLRGRPSLRTVFLLIDSRHGLKDIDREMMKMLDTAAVSYRLILTKADEPKAEEIAERILAIQAEIKRNPAAYPDVFAVSSRTGAGLETLRETVLGVAEQA